MTDRILGTPNLPRPPAGVRNPQAISNFLVGLVARLTAYFYDVVLTLNNMPTLQGTRPMVAPFPLATFTVATRPAATAWAAGVIFVSDGGAGAVFQGSNGTAWVNLG